MTAFPRHLRGTLWLSVKHRKLAMAETCDDVDSGNEYAPAHCGGFTPRPAERGQ